MKHWVAAWWLALGSSVATGCEHGSANTPPKQTASVAAVGAPSPASPQAAAAPVSKAQVVKAATGWVDALRASDRGRLQQLSAAPFELREPAEYANCETAKAEAVGDVPAAVGCLLEDSLLMEELAAQRKPLTAAIARAALPKWAAPSLQASDVPAGEPVLVQLPGNGVSYQLVLWVTPAGVAGVWKYAEYDPN